MKIAVLILYLNIAISVCSHVQSDDSSKATEVVASPEPTVTATIPETIVPDPSGTKPVFHELIDEVASSVGEQKLREIDLSANDIEVRVWAGFGMTSLHGFVLRRNDKKWSASEITSDFKMPRGLSYKEIPLSMPTAGWEEAWQRMLKHRLLTLPNAEAINCSAMHEDGYSYVVEIKKGDDYRTYLYDNPGARFENRCSEADEILAIASIITKDYSVTDFQWDD
jgi:hypothetical protein